MSGAFLILLAILVVSILVVVVFMIVLRRGTFAKVEDVHERLAKEREEQGLPTAALNQNGDAGEEGGEPAEPPAGVETEPQEQPQSPDQAAQVQRDTG